MDGNRLTAIQFGIETTSKAVNSHTTNELSDLVDKRHRCLTQLRDLGRKQAELIDAGEMPALLRLISTKNQLIAALQSIEQALAPFHDQDPETRLWESPSAREDCSKLVQSCQQLLEEVMSLERQNEQNMVQRRDQLAVQLEAVQSANTARGAYQAHQGSPLRGPKHPPASPVPISTNSQGHNLDLHSEV